MATCTKVKQSGQSFTCGIKNMGFVYLLCVLVFVACFESSLSLKDKCGSGGQCPYSQCICTDVSVECHDEPRIQQDILGLFDCIGDYVNEVVITGSVILEVQKNFLGSCRKDTSLRLHNLTKLDISNNGIRTIHGKSFHCMPVLDTLNLAHNDWTIDFHPDQTGYFTSVPDLKHLDLTNAFDEVWNGTLHFSKLAVIFRETDMTKLETLKLGQNEMFTFSAQAANSLCELESLRTLDLSHNKLSLPGLPTHSPCLEDLENLNLTYNAMPRLPPEFMSKLEGLAKLKEVWLGHNEYRCDCSLIDTYNWMQKTRVNIADPDDILCKDGYHSSYINKTVLELKLSDLKCMQLSVQSNTAVRVVTGLIFAVIGVTMVAFLVINRAHVRKFATKCGKRMPKLNLRSHSGYKSVQEPGVAHL